MLLRGGVDLTDYSFLEQQAFIAYERKEQTMRFIEQAVQIYATATSSEHAQTLVNRLRDELFVGHAAMQADKDRRLSDELLQAVKSSYTLTTAGGRAILEMNHD